jgi:hypothetical protein
MADWFSEMVADLADEVIDNQGGREKLAAAELTPAAAKAELLGAAEELRIQVESAAGQVEDIQDEIQRSERQVLESEWNAIVQAQRNLSELKQRADQQQAQRTEQPATTSVRPAWWRLPWRHHPATTPDGTERVAAELEAAEAGLQRANKAYDDALRSKKVDEIPSISRLRGTAAQAKSRLRPQLSQAVTLRFNGMIDSRLDSRYETDFSYVGKPILTDPLDLAVQPVDVDAYQKISYLIDNVGTGTVGVAGPRGCGKSTLLSRFARTMRSDHGVVTQWGVCVPAPAKYNARDFLLYLFSQLCVAVLGPAQTRELEASLTATSPPTGRAPFIVWDLTLIASAALAWGGLAIGLRTADLHESPDRLTDLIIACGATVTAAVLVVDLFLRGRDPLPGLPRWLQRREYLFRSVELTLTILSLAVAAVLFSLLFWAGVTPTPGYLAAGGLGAAAIMTLISILTYLWERWHLLAFDSERDYLDRRYVSRLEGVAADWYGRIKLQQSFTTGWSGTVTVGSSSLPLQAQAGLSGSTQVTLLAMSIPEIVAAISSFIANLAEPALNDRMSPPILPDAEEIPSHVRVVIGIDEIDKIEEPRDAQAFFNQIKGLFGDSRCLFLVSISDDAMAAFEQRGLPFRDAFDSSLSSVVTLSFLSRTQARKLTGSRLVSVQEPVADLLFILSGGLARDLVRLIRQAVQAGEEGIQVSQLADKLITAEAEAKKRAVLARARALEASCPAIASLLVWAGTRGLTAGKSSDDLLASGQSILNTSRAPHGHQQGTCPSREIGAYLVWLATVGQIFGACSSRADFEAGELDTAGNTKSFERLAETRQNLSLGPDYVIPAIDGLRTAWGLAELDPQA